jgi:SAM-dependent methyltransferase
MLDRARAARIQQLTGCRPEDHASAVSRTPDHVLRNRLAWDQWARDYAGLGLRGWAAEPSWGIWGVPEAQAGVLPPDLNGRSSIELGCGTGYVSAWLARRGARPVGLDNSAAQLATARALQDRFGLRFPLIHASAEQVPFAGASFDVAISEYGTNIWCDPYAWIPEAARLLRPGGQLIFLVNSVLLMLTVPGQEGLPATKRLLRPYFGMHRFEWPDDDSVEFHLGHGDMIQPLPGAVASHPLVTWGMGPPMALRRSLEGPQTVLNRPAGWFWRSDCDQQASGQQRLGCLAAGARSLAIGFFRVLRAGAVECFRC